MRIPAEATQDIKESFREVWIALEPFLSKNIDLKGRKFKNAGKPTGNGDFVILDWLNAELLELEESLGNDIEAAKPQTKDILYISGIHLTNSTVDPVAPDTGGILYAKAGALWYISQGGHRHEIVTNT